MPSSNYDPTTQPHLATWKDRQALNIKMMRCPQCKRTGYKPYIWPDGTIVAEECGRCDHETKCAYHKTPKEWFKEHGNPNFKEHENKNYLPPEPPPMLKVPSEMVSQMYCLRKGQVKNPLLRYWTDLFSKGEKAADFTDRWLKALNTFAIGTMPGGFTIFWIVDENKVIRSGKAMRYLPNGHRDKDETKVGFKWMHSMARLYYPNIPANAEYVGCLFGLHQLKGKGQKIGIVESEKTALLMTVFSPQLTWMATGSKNNLNELRLEPLIKAECNITLFPDLDGYKDWEERKAAIKRQYPKANITISQHVKKSWGPELSDHADILDEMERDYILTYL